jgi:NADPH:quinone reductase-like Zn-dependent oxidoreductase
LADLPVPEPEDDGVRVRVRAASVNMADVDYLRGHPKIARLGTGLRRPNNRQLGVDVAGVVEAVGEKVTLLRPGDEVMGDLTEHGFGAFAEYACAPQDAFARIPTGSTFEEAATLPQAGVMAAQGLCRGGHRVQSGHRVLVNGAGGNVGPFAVQLAKASCADVTAVDAAWKLDMIRSVGADRTLDYAVTDFTKTGDRYDWIFDVAPFHSIRACRRALQPDGVYVMIPATIPHLMKAMVAGPILSLLGGRKMGMPAWNVFNRQDVALLTRLFESGELKPAIDRSYPLHDVPDALRYQASGQVAGKIVITV